MANSFFATINSAGVKITQADQAFAGTGFCRVALAKTSVATKTENAAIMAAQGRTLFPVVQVLALLVNIRAADVRVFVATRMGFAPTTDVRV